MGTSRRRSELIRSRGMLALLAAAAAAMFLLSAGPAAALQTRANTLSFGTDGTSGTTISGGSGLAFQQSTKRLYVTSFSPQGIYVFDASTPGTYTPIPGLNPFSIPTGPSGYPGLGVDGSGNVYMATESNSRLYGFDSTGAALAAFGGTSGINPATNPGAPNGSPTDICGGAVDGSGNVWIANYSTNRILEYDSSGTFIKAVITSPLPGGAEGKPCQMAFDKTSGDMYVQMYNGGTVWKFSAPTYAVASAVKIDPYPGGPGGAFGIAVDGTTHHVFVSHGNAIVEYDGSGTMVGEFGSNIANAGFRGVAVNEATNEVYVGDNSKVRVFGGYVIVPDVTTGTASNIQRTTADVEGTVDPAGGGEVTECIVEWAPEAQFGGFESYSPSRTVPCTNSLPITSAEGISAHLTGLTAQKKFQYRFKVGNVNGPDYGTSHELTTDNAVTNVQTGAATEVLLTTATLHGSFESESIPTEFFFEYGNEEGFFGPIYDHSTTPTLAAADSVSASVSALEGERTYHFRLVARNSYGNTVGPDETFFTAQEAEVSNTQYVTNVNTDTALVHFGVSPNGLETTYRVEYGPEDCSLGGCQAAEDRIQGPALGLKDLNFRLEGLSPDTTYHYRVSAENARGSAVSTVDHHFTTFARPVFSESCPNSLARQQTGAAFLLDCRAYELVSARDTGGYSVESDLVAGQHPFAGYPDASEPSRVLYGIHDGGIPGTGSPTNNGVDPYVATRGDDGWHTKYVGIPAAGTPSAGPFASGVLGADSVLTDFAFGGSDMCNPCFEDGSRGIPLRTPEGDLIQGIGGSLPVANPEPSGEVKAPFSADGSHFVFGSEQQFEPAGNPDNGNVTIYSRNLSEGGTEVVSTDSSGATLSDGSKVIELGISNDGSRVLIGDLVRVDRGVRYWHLYLHIAGQPDSVDLTPETASGDPVTGALFSGMTADGSTVFFATRDQMTADDEDTSVDLYRADLTGAGAQLARVSTGEAGTGNDDACDPAGNSYDPEQWNSVPGEPADCSIVAVGGGGGIAAASGSAYFLSPEKLDGSGIEGAPNLFVAKPGKAPSYVATLESGATAALPEPVHSTVRSTGSFVGPAGVAIDNQTGSYYVLDNNGALGAPGAYVQKFDSEGKIDKNYGVNGKIDGLSAPTGAFTEFALLGPSEIAVDNHEGSPSYGDLYVPDLFNQVIDRFEPDGTYAGQIEVPAFPTAVTVDQSTGDVYVTTTFESVYVYEPSGAPITTLADLSRICGGGRGGRFGRKRLHRQQRRSQEVRLQRHPD